MLQLVHILVLSEKPVHSTHCKADLLVFQSSFTTYHRDSRQEFAKVGGVFPILRMLFLLDAKVCFLPSDNGFSQIFCNCLHLDEIFSWHNGAISLSQNVQQKF